MIRMSKRLWDELDDNRRSDYELLNEELQGSDPAYVYVDIRKVPEP